ncbi:outer membrane beta-barrel protein [Halorhodospira halochloris]|uniref:outer membrane protein n=1 Tax=Halorhodospira halochloris TaxID=1052 RepID=UPI001EE87873|nr:outer membrane beta-barrel protein [Halorhodospira halochloris]MCG5531034.1 outer membrane beta-barrel protein [Halorhodospira halochloris]
MLRQSSYVAIAAAGGLGLVFAGPAKSEFFSGPYVGVEGDLTSAVTFVHEEDDGDTATHGIEDPLTGGSAILGIGHQEGGLYYGLEARYTFGDREGEVEDEEFEDFARIADFELGDGYSFSARLGSLLYDGTVMLYGSVGYVQREFSADIEGTITDVPDVPDLGDYDVAGDEDFSGYRAAIGMEYRPTNVPIRVHVEGSRSDLGDETIELEGTSTKKGEIGVDDGWEEEIDDLVEHAFHVGVAYTFE